MHLHKTFMLVLLCLVLLPSFSMAQSQRGRGGRPPATEQPSTPEPEKPETPATPAEDPLPEPVPPPPSTTPPPATTPPPSQAEEVPAGRTPLGYAWEYTSTKGEPPPVWHLMRTQTSTASEGEPTQQETVTLTALDAAACQKMLAADASGYTPGETSCATFDCPGAGAYSILLQAEVNGTPSKPSNVVTFGLTASCTTVPYADALATAIPVERSPTTTPVSTKNTTTPVSTENTTISEPAEAQAAHVAPSNAPETPSPSTGLGGVAEALAEFLRVEETYQTTLQEVRTAYAMSLAEAAQKKDPQAAWKAYTQAHAQQSAAYRTAYEGWQRAFTQLMQVVMGEAVPETSTASAGLGSQAPTATEVLAGQTPASPASQSLKTTTATQKREESEVVASHDPAPRPQTTSQEIPPPVTTQAQPGEKTPAGTTATTATPATTRPTTTTTSTHREAGEGPVHAETTTVVTASGGTTSAPQVTSTLTTTPSGTEEPPETMEEEDE